MNNEELIILVDELRALPRETEWVEFKKGTATTNERLGMYISGLSNSACVKNQDFAYLIFGIDDVTHEVIGTNFNFKSAKEGNEELELWIRRYLSPSLSFEYDVCQYNINSRIELFRIPAAKGEPVSFLNYQKIRIGTSLTDLKKHTDLARLIYNSQIDWSAKTIEKATIYDLDSEAITQARVKFKEKNSTKTWFNEIDNWNDAQFLDRAKITINGKITNTAILLLGKEESAHYISPAVAQITWKLDTEESAYEHFEIPLFITVNKIVQRIRNVKYKFFPDNQLIATEVQKYDTEVILEALNNCIAHQDYGRNARIILVEKVNKLIFRNVGGFFEGKAEDYCEGNLTPQKYRNKWLANAMVNLNMIDSLGFGISKMYRSQMKRFFPLPDYTHTTANEVLLEIYGHTIDVNYSKLLIEKKDALSLTEVVLLDRIQKGMTITEDAARLLKKNQLIEGRKPNYLISAEIAAITNQKATYTKSKGLNKEILKSFILQHIDNHGYATREEIDELLLDKLPEYLDDRQRKKMLDNLLQGMKKSKIQNVGTRSFPKWTRISKKRNDLGKN
jgi:ATP-dependent DNA helicase RecG